MRRRHRRRKFEHPLGRAQRLRRELLRAAIVAAAIVLMWLMLAMMLSMIA